jgi:hypothetical protein
LVKPPSIKHNIAASDRLIYAVRSLGKDNFFILEEIIMLKRIILAGAAIMVFATAAQAGSCPLRMAKIDAILPVKASKLGASNLARVKSLRAQGQAEHKAGDHGASIQSLAGAMKILGIS